MYKTHHTTIAIFETDTVSLYRGMTYTSRLRVEHSFRHSKIDSWLEDAKQLERNKTDQDALTEVLFRVFMNASDN